MVNLIYLRKAAVSLDLTVLVEVHDAQDLERVLQIGGFPLIGINNRDLTSFQTDLATTERLMNDFATRLKQDNVLLVSESGLLNRADLDRVQAVGADQDALSCVGQFVDAVFTFTFVALFALALVHDCCLDPEEGFTFE